MRRKKTGPRPSPKQYRQPPFGYKYINGEHIPDEATSGLVHDIFYMFANKETLTDIAWKMKGEEWPTARGGRWTPWTIRKILSNRFYVDSDQPIVTEEMFNKAANRLAKLRPGPQ